MIHCRYNKLVFVIAFVFTGCKIGKVAQDTKSQIVKVEIRETTHVDTIMMYLQLPKQEVTHLVPDTCDTIKTPYATSIAQVRSDGQLQHSLICFPLPIQVPTFKEVTIRDTTYLQLDKETIVEYVEKELSTMQKISMAGFWIILLLAGAALYIKVRLRHR